MRLKGTSRTMETTGVRTLPHTPQNLPPAQVRMAILTAVDRLDRGGPEAAGPLLRPLVERNKWRDPRDSKGDKIRGLLSVRLPLETLHVPCWTDAELKPRAEVGEELQVIDS